MNMKQYLDKINDKEVSVYFNKQHDSIRHFFLDMETRGFPQTMLPYYFPVIVFSKNNTIIELIGYDAEADELVTNTVFNKNEYSGHSFVLEEAK